MLKRLELFMRVVFLGAVMAVLFQGCGLKADPAPRQIKPLQPVTDLKLLKNAGGILVQWRLQEADGRTVRFKLMRGEFGPDGRSCPGCPPDEIQLADFASGRAKLAGAEANTFGYQDSSVASDRTYRYRVIGCDRPGFCSEPSMPVMLNMATDPASDNAAANGPVRIESSTR